MYDDLKIFQKIVESKGIVKAATPLKLTAGAVTTALQRLEARLNLSLIERSTRSFRVTAEGEALFEVLQRNLGEIEDQILLLQNDHSLFRGTLKIGCVSSYFHKRLSPIISKFNQRHPELLLEIVVNDEPSNLLAEGFDIGIRIGKFPASELMIKKIEKLKVITAASTKYLERVGSPNSVEELEAFHTVGFLLPGIGTPYVWKFGRKSFKFSHPLVCSSIEGVVELGKCDAGIFQAPQYLFSEELADGSITELFPELDSSINAFFCYPKGRGRLKKVSQFIQFIQDNL